MATQGYGYGGYDASAGAWGAAGYGQLQPPTSQQKALHLQEFSTDEATPRTVFVGGLAMGVTEELIHTLFSQIGALTKCKLVFESGTEPYAFVEFADHDTATQALVAMNKRVLLGSEMKLSWATTPNTNANKVDTSKHFHVFVGDLSPEVDMKMLKDAFNIYGEISDCKVIRDAQTLKSKGYGFVSFVTKEEAEKAIEGMNGQWIGRRTVRTNWATRKPGNANTKPLTYDEVYNSTTPSNTTVYIGGTPANTTEEDIRSVFGKYGNITEIRLFKAQGYAFARFDTKDSAAQAIVNLNGSEVAGSPVRCSWGKQPEATSNNSASSTGTYGYAYGYGGSGPAGGGGAAQGGQNPAAWNQYWQNYYQANPALMQQWQSYYQQQGQQ